MPVFDCQCWLGGGIVPGMSQTPASVVSDMSAHGIDRALLLSAHARLVDPLAGNRFVKAALSNAPALLGGLVAHVNRAEQSVTAMRELMPLRRFVGMALAANTLEEPIGQNLADEVLNAYRRYCKPLLLFALNGASVERALAIAKSYPMLKVVLIGMGGRDWRQAIHAAHSATNIVLETSGALEQAKLPAAVEALGAHRLVFGSGSPGTCASAALGMISDTGLSDDAKRRILWDNAVRLFDLEEAPPTEE